MKIFRFSLLLLLVMPVFSESSALAVRVNAITRKFHVENWRVYILDEAAWEKMGRKFNFLSATDQAASFPKDRFTLIRKSRTESMGESELQDLLAHEAGHILCNCSDEVRADSFAEHLLNREKP